MFLPLDSVFFNLFMYFYYFYGSISSVEGVLSTKQPTKLPSAAEPIEDVHFFPDLTHVPRFTLLYLICYLWTQRWTVFTVNIFWCYLAFAATSVSESCLLCSLRELQSQLLGCLQRWCHARTNAFILKQRCRNLRRPFVQGPRTCAPLEHNPEHAPFKYYRVWPMLSYEFDSLEQFFAFVSSWPLTSPHLTLQQQSIQLRFFCCL